MLVAACMERRLRPAINPNAGRDSLLDYALPI